MTQIDTAAEILNKGGRGIVPTETVCGVGGLITKTGAIKRLYSLKQRDKNRPTLALAKDLDQAREWVAFNEGAEKLAAAFWPGPLTICLPVKKSVPEALLGPGNTLGVRVSSHPFLKQLLPRLESPLLAPSANFQGKLMPKSYTEIDKQLASLVDYVVDIEPEAKIPSTIVSFAEQKYNLVRKGPITQGAIDKVLKTKE